MPGPTGWHRDDDAVGRTVDHLRAQSLPGVFAEAVPHYTPEQARAGRTHCVDWDNEVEVCGRVLDPWQQVIGSCVGYGTARAITAMMIDRVARRDIPEFHAPVSPAAIYGGARVNVGRGRLGYGDGAVVADAIRWAMQSVLLQQEYRIAGVQMVDLGHDSLDTIAKQWGQPGRGVPPQLAEIGTALAITGAVQCQTIDDLQASLWLRHWVTGGCDWIDTERRDADGCCRPDRIAPHCQNRCGIARTRNSGTVILKRQSWGVMIPSGPQKMPLEDGSTLDLPAGVYGVRLEDEARMMRNGAADYWAVKGGGYDWVPERIKYEGAV